MSVNNRKNVAYGLSQALVDVSPAPIVSSRNPSTNDFAPIGQLWINQDLNTAYILTSIAANSANWLAI